MPGYRVIPVDGLAISRRQGLGRIVNSALLGGLARAVGDPPLAVLERLLLERSPKLRERERRRLHRRLSRRRCATQGAAR